MNFIRGANPCTRIRFLDSRRSTTDRKLFLQISTLSPQGSFPVSADIFLPFDREEGGCIFHADRPCADSFIRINGVFFFFPFFFLSFFLRFSFLVFVFVLVFFFCFFLRAEISTPSTPSLPREEGGGEKQSFRFV